MRRTNALKFEYIAENTMGSEMLFALQFKEPLVIYDDSDPFKFAMVNDWEMTLSDRKGKISFYLTFRTSDDTVTLKRL